MVLVAFAFSVALTPLVRRTAIKLGLVDHPDERRKMHGRAIALGGGIAVLISTFAAMGAGLVATVHLVDPQQRGPLLGLAVASIVLCLVGLIDDARGLRARQKLVGQVIAGLIVIASGTVIHSVQLFGYTMELGLLAWPITLFWLMGAVNSVNLIDGADGLATTVGIILAGTIAAMAVNTGNYVEAGLALALMGSLLGFLVFNFPPASIFLGDAGSMFIGLLAGVLAIRASVKGAASFAFAAPLAIWAIPAFDCGIAILRRKLTGWSLAMTDRGHLHHCLLRRGYGDRQLLAWVTVLCATTSFGALLSLHLQHEAIALGCALAVLGLLVSTRIFGHAEFLLLSSRVMDFSTSLLKPAFRGVAVRRSSVRLQGSREWEQLWEEIVSAAPGMNVVSARLTMNLPWLHESYHALWNQENAHYPSDLWYLEIPLRLNGRTVGQVRVSGYGDYGTTGLQLARFAELFGSIESQLAVLASARDLDLAPPQDPSRSDGQSQASADQVHASPGTEPELLMPTAVSHEAMSDEAEPLP
jgi:UDP-GlcNAc:undecaprenyl-phosphate GlcNAc-1-phosphate transferase